LTTPPETNVPGFKLTIRPAGVEPPPWRYSQLAPVSVEVDALTFSAALLEVIVNGVVAGGRGWPFWRLKETDVGATLREAAPTCVPPVMVNITGTLSGPLAAPAVAMVTDPT
jgi:hypothetical protein